MAHPPRFPDLDEVPTPGAYLRRRRQAAILTVDQVAARLCALPWAAVPPSQLQHARLTQRLTQAENGGWPFTAPQASLLRQIFRFDLDVYLALIDLAAAGPDYGLAVPRLCRNCGCSWHDACVGDDGPCAWSDTHPHHCTACETATMPRSLELVS